LRLEGEAGLPQNSFIVTYSDDLEADADVMDVLSDGIPGVELSSLPSQVSIGRMGIRASLGGNSMTLGNKVAELSGPVSLGSLAPLHGPDEPRGEDMFITEQDLENLQGDQVTEETIRRVLAKIARLARMFE
jgi:hypothetical protein